MIEVKA